MQTDMHGVYLVDEPEAHLHPKAVASVAQWLAKLAESASGVVVATHSTTVLDAPSEVATRVLVTSGPNGTLLRELRGQLATALEDVASELGLHPGELLLLTRLALFVEGPHDVAVLDEWFRADLQAAGVRLFPLHGVDNISYLVDSEVIAALGLKMAALVDDASADKIRRGGQPGSYEEGMISRLLYEARLAKRPIQAFGLDQHDIVDYLDDAVCQAKAPAFPGWRQAEKAWNRAGRPEEFKRWVSHEYHLALDRRSVRALARTCKAEGKVHPEVRSVIQEILAFAGPWEVDE
jgi:hypothetical protein